MSGGRGTERRAMAGAVLVRLPGELAARVAASADAEGLSAAAYLRRLAAAAAGAAPDVVRPSPPRRPVPPPPPEAVKEIARLREVVGEAVGAITRSAVFTRDVGNAKTHADLEALLPVFRAAARDLDAVKIALLPPLSKSRRR